MAELLRSPLSAPNLAGRLERCLVQSDLLRGNALGDPATRELPVYLPPGYENLGPLPCIWLLAGFTGRGAKYAEVSGFAPSLVQSFDRLVALGEVPPAMLVMPDAFTRLGGSQYVDSSATGPYASHLVRELLPLVEAHFPAGAHGLVGKSSGGFGALHLVRSYPGQFAAAASISGDCCFELCYAADFPAALRGLARHGFDPLTFLAAIEGRGPNSADEHTTLGALAMAACYSPNPSSPLGFDLPFDLHSAERIELVWRRWLHFDPLQAAEEAAPAWSQLALLHVECGLADEYHLQWGLRRLVRRLVELGVPHQHLEHPGGHRHIDGRILAVLGPMVRALAGGSATAPGAEPRKYP